MPTSRVAGSTLARTSVLILVLPALFAAPAGIGAAEPSPGAAKQPWTLEKILEVRDVGDPRPSPDGRRVVFVVTEPSDESNSLDTDLYLASIPAAGGTPAEAIRLTRSPKSDHGPRFSPAGDLIAFISSRDPGKKTDERGSQPWLIRPDGGEAWQAATVEGDSDSLEWSPDGKVLALLATEPLSTDRRQREKDKADWTVVDSEFRRNQVWLADVDSGAAVQVTRGPVHFTDLDWSPDGSRLALGGQPTPKVPDAFDANIYLLDLTRALGALKEEAKRKPATGAEEKMSGGKDPNAPPPPALGEARPLLPGACVCSTPRFSPDGTTIAFITQDGNSEWYTNAYVATARASGGGLRLLTRSFDEEASEISWTPDGSRLLFQAGSRLANHIYRVSSQGGKVEPVTGGDDVNRSASISENGRTIVYVHEAPAEPMEVMAIDVTPEGFMGTPRRVTAINGWTKEMATAAKEPFHWKGAGGMEMEGIVVKPEGAAAGRKLPLLTIVHGGPAGSFANNFSIRRGAYPIQIFAQKGFAVFMPNPRGSGAYGEDFRAANRRDWGEKDYEDIMSGIDALIAQGVADPNRLGIMGWSYGGYMTSRVITKTRRFAAASVGAGVTDTYSFVGTADIPPFMRSYFGAWPWEEPALYTSHTAIFNVKGVTTPTLIQHGEADARVPISQGWELYIALREQKVPVEFVTYPRQGHGFSEPKLIRDAMRRNVEWFSRWILGEKNP